MDTTHTRLLLVDDYADALEVWSLYLRMQGFEVVTAVDGEDAVEMAHRTLPDLIILDLELPRLSGCDAARRLRAADDTARIPMIAATGHSIGTLLNDAKLAGFDAVLTKPCDPDMLMSEIERLLTPPASASADGYTATVNR